MSSRRDDQDLVALCVTGEPGAWRTFVDRFAPTVRVVARRTLKVYGHRAIDADLDDLVQDVFVAVTRKDYKLLRQYDPTYSFKTYLGVITRTEVHRLLRKRRHPTGSLDAAADQETDGPAALDAAGLQEEKDLVERALGDLPERDAEVLRLRYFRELDYKGIAARLGIPESSVGQTLFRAKRRLLERVRSLVGEPAPSRSGPGAT